MRAGSERGGAGVGARQGGVRGLPCSGPPPHDGPGRASVLRAPDPAPLLRHREQQQLERRARALSARLSRGDRQGPRAQGAPRGRALMAQLVAAMAMTHSPGMTGWFTQAPKDQQELTLRATAELRQRLDAARPDVVTMFSNDHLLNWPLNNPPDFAGGIGDEHGGPADWFDEWLAMEKYHVPGHSSLARFIVNESARHGLALAHLRDMQFDDGISVPTHYLNPDGKFRLIPVTMNCTVPPIPEPARAYAVGAILRDVVRAYPGAERVAMVATGGLSHEPGGPRYFWGDEGVDPGVLDLLKHRGHAA